MRLVLDTVVMVAAIRSDSGASRALLAQALLGRYDVLVSVPLMVEYQDVMSREEHLTASGLSQRDIDDLLDAVASVAVPVRLAYLWRPVASDPNDDMVLETAANGQADAIVSFNARHLEHPAKRFGIAVIRPAEALSMLEKRR